MRKRYFKADITVYKEVRKEHH